MMLTRTGKMVLDHHIITLVHKSREDIPVSLEELVLEIHESPEMIKQIIPHRYFNDMLTSLFWVMNEHTPSMASVAGNASFLLGAILEDDVGRNKFIEVLMDESRPEDKGYLMPSLTALIQTHELEAMTNASGTMSLLLESNEIRDWALEQTSIEWTVLILAQSLFDERDLWVASNCALSLARICTTSKGQQLILAHKQGSEILKMLMASCGIDREGRGMNAVFALAYMCETEEGTIRITDLKECIEFQLALINMLRSVEDGCRRNAAFCLKNMSQWKNGQDSVNQDLDIEQLLNTMCNLLTCGDEDLGKMAAVCIANLGDRREGYMLQKDKSNAKASLQHVLSQMAISDGYRKDAFSAIKILMIPKPEPPRLKVLDAYSISAEWDAVVAKSGSEVMYELYCGEGIVYTGAEPSYTMSGLKERTEYEFRLRAFTEDDEESFVSESCVVQTFRAISSPPRNIRATSVTSAQMKLVWEKPAKICGNLKGYYVQDTDSTIHYSPVDMYYFISNLEPDKEYTFEVCAVTQRGRGEVATITVRTLRQDFNAPSKPVLSSVGGEVVVTWKPPVAPTGRITGYEVLCNGKSVYFGLPLRCVPKVEAGSKYTFTVVAWTSQGRNESQPASKFVQVKNKTKKGVKGKQDEVTQWSEAKDDGDVEDECGEEESEPHRQQTDATSVEQPENDDDDDGEGDDSQQHQHHQQHQRLADEEDDGRGSGSENDDDEDEY